MGFSLGHLMLDWGVDVIGGPVGAVVTPTQALVLVVGAALYAAWTSALVVAGQGSRRAMAATLPLCATGALGNGLSIVACPPPCGGAAPLGDLTHIGSLAFGAWALYESRRALARARSREREPARTASGTPRGPDTT
jgi:hypothetical protein